MNRSTSSICALIKRLRYDRRRFIGFPKSAILKELHHGLGVLKRVMFSNLPSFAIPVNLFHPCNLRAEPFISFCFIFFTRFTLRKGSACRVPSLFLNGLYCYLFSIFVSNVNYDFFRLLSIYSLFFTRPKSLNTIGKQISHYSSQCLYRFQMILYFFLQGCLFLKEARYAFYKKLLHSCTTRMPK